MGFFSSLFSGIGSIVTGVAKAAVGCIGKVLSGAVGALSTLGNSIGGILGGVLSKAAGLLGVFGSIMAGPLGPILAPILVQLLVHVAGKIMEKIAQKNGDIDEEDKVEEVGYRMEEAAQHDDWKKPEDFGSFREYNEYMKEMVPNIDPEKMRQNLCKYTVAGTAALQTATEKRCGITLPDDFLFDFARAKMTESEVMLVIEAFQALGSGSVQLHDFLTGKLPANKMAEIQKAIQQVYQKAYPDKSALDITNRINAWKKSAMDDKAVAENYHEEIQSAAKDMRQQADHGAKKEDIFMDPRPYVRVEE